jgi:hypothetical protein
MKVAAIAAIALALLGWMPFGASAQQATPGPDVPPAGEFIVTPSSGPPGTLVTVTGEFDQPISYVEFRCVYQGEPYEALESAYSVPEPSTSISFEYRIPAQLPIRMGGGATYPTGGDCAFHAVAWHRLLSASVPFAVTAPGLPVTGLGSRDENGPPWAVAEALAAAGLAALALAACLAWRRGSLPY